MNFTDKSENPSCVYISHQILNVVLGEQLAGFILRGQRDSTKLDDNPPATSGLTDTAIPGVMPLSGLNIRWLLFAVNKLAKIYANSMDSLLLNALEFQVIGIWIVTIKKSREPAQNQRMPTPHSTDDSKV